MSAISESSAASTDTGKETTWIGRPLPRMEDQRFLVGKGRYVDDIVLPNQLFAAFVRSPHGHARVSKLDLSKARSASGVVAAYGGSDIQGLKDVPPNWVLPGSHVKGRPPLVRETVRHVGEAVAVIIAETQAEAVDAAALVDVTYEVFPALIDQNLALEEGAPRVHADIKNNTATIMPAGAGGFDAAAEAYLNIKLTVKNQRLIPFPIEPRAVNADFDAATSRLTFYSSNQIPHMLRRMLAAALEFPEHKLRVISPDVGGGFGPKMHFYPEELLLAWLTIWWPISRRTPTEKFSH